MTWCYAFDDDDRPKQHAPGESKYAYRKGELRPYGWNDDEPELVDQKHLNKLSRGDDASVRALTSQIRAKELQ
jgi:hypothetical protein